MGQFSHNKFREHLFRFPGEGKVPSQFEKSISQGQEWEIEEQGSG